MKLHLNSQPDTKTESENKVIIGQSEARVVTEIDSKRTLATNKGIQYREIAFKCPHCFMVLYANAKHAPRYLYNHVQKFHLDPIIEGHSIGVFF